MDCGDDGGRWEMGFLICRVELGFRVSARAVMSFRPVLREAVSGGEAQERGRAGRGGCFACRTAFSPAYVCTAGRFPVGSRGCWCAVM